MAYRRLKLPHLQPLGATFSVLFLLKDAVPSPLLQKLSRERIAELSSIKSKKLPGWKRALVAAQISFDRQLDDLLRRHANQSHALADPKAAKIVVDRLKEYHGEYYDLYSYSVMSNHVHTELDFSVQLPDNWKEGQPPAGYIQLNKVVNLIKGGSARYVNQLLGRTGMPLWSIRYRDRFIRGERHLKYACTYKKTMQLPPGWLNVGMSTRLVEGLLSRRLQTGSTDGFILMWGFGWSSFANLIRIRVKFRSRPSDFGWLRSDLKAV